MSTESVSFSRTMVNYNVSTTFQLILRKKFCDVQMPSNDHEVILVDESEREYSVTFLINGHKFGSGWRDFVIAHGLRVGDNLSFQLIDKYKFKVHVTRFTENEFQNYVPVSFGRRKGKRKDLTEENACFGKVANKYLGSCVEMQERMLSQIKKRVHGEVVSKQKVFIESPHRSTETSGASGSSYVNFHDCRDDDEHTGIVEKELPAVNVINVNDKTMLVSDYDSSPPEDQLITIENSESALSVNGETLDSEIPQDVRIKYYQLCCGKKKFIHDHAVLNSKSTKTAIISASPHDLERMGKMLQYFEDLGFAVESFRAKISAKISTLAKSSNAHQTVEGESNSVEFSESALTFINFEDFKVDMNGVTLDSEIPPDVRMRYYQLCCCENKLIHDRVMKGINGKFAVSVILEIVRIADFAKATTVLTAPRVLQCMVKTLRSFEELGFAVKILRGKIGMLLIFKHDHQKATRRISELESEGTKGSTTSQNMGIDIDALKRTRERLELVIREAAGSTLYGRHTLREVFSLV